MIEIRDAVETDDAALVDLQKRCPMGSSLILQLDSSPSFFNRSKHQTENHVVVAEEDGNIVSSGSCAIMEKCVNGKILRTAYNYNLMVDPNYRRRGIAVLLVDRREEIAREQDCDLIFCQITEGNIPSIRLQEKKGYMHVKDSTSYVLLVYKQHKLSITANIRPAEKTDLPIIVNLINNIHSDYDLYSPQKVEDFSNLVEKRAFYDLHNIIVFEKEGKVEACLGYWDYNKVTKMTVLQLSRKNQIMNLALTFLGIFTKMPKIPDSGQLMKQYFVQDVGFTKPEYLTELVKHLNNIALENDIQYLTMMGVEAPISDVLSKFMNTTSTEHVYAKPLKELDLTGFGQRKLFLSME
ncbi:MAG: GNAT family N-acetyltransferase [Candidatus Thorarchaeota archaeon]|nr:GNAT family N-acetyltransferase [Candidatus Thorarchaeota archaeon]